MKLKFGSARTIAMLTSLLLLLSLLPVSGQVQAQPAPYTPIPEVTSGFTGPLTWTNFTQPTAPDPVNGGYFPFFLDVGADNNIYMTTIKYQTSGTTAGGKVEKVSSDGQTITDISYDGGFYFPIGITVDHDGNVYVTDNSKFTISGDTYTGNVARIMKLPVGTTSWVDITNGVSMSYGVGIAADHFGNIYAADTTLSSGGTPPPSHIYKLPNGQSTWVDITSTPSPFSRAIDIATDGEGNVFVSDLASSGMTAARIMKLPVGETTWMNVAPTTLTDEMPFITYGLDVDKYDNVYAMNVFNGSVMKLKYNGTSDDWTTIQTAVPSSFLSFDVAGDNAGYIYAAPFGLGNLTKLMATIQYDGNGYTGGAAPVDSTLYGPSGTATIAGNTGSLENTGLSFVGWNTKADGSGTAYAPGATVTMTQSVVLYAVWATPSTITYDGNGSTSGSAPVDSTIYNPGATATVSGNTGSLVKSGFSFAGWNTKADGTGTAYASGASINMTQNLTLYAVWSEQSTIAYDGNGSTSGSAPVDSTLYNPGTTATVSGNTGSLVKSGYSFADWNTKADGTGTAYASGATITMTQNLTLYAVWAPIPQYTVSYQAGVGGSLSGTVSEAVYSGSSPAAVPTATPNSDYTFSGWSADGGKTLLTSVQVASSTVTGNIAYTAYFMPKASLTAISLDSTSYSLQRSATHQTVVTAVYSDLSTFLLSAGVTFSSSNETVTSVSYTGLVTAIGSGQSVITAVYGGQQSQATVTVVASSNPYSSGYSGSTSTNSGVEIIVDGVKQDQVATAKQETVNGQTVTTVVLDSKKVNDMLEKDNNNLVTIPVSGDSAVVVGELTGSLIKTLQSKNAQIQIVTDRATYTLPASQINIDSISAQVGSNVKLEDISVRIQISATTGDKAAQVQSAAQRDQIKTVVSPVDFEISASYGSQTVLANKFNSYVDRMIALPEGVDASNLTTGVVLTADGELLHVPTVVVKQDGKTYALIKSLTNSTYSVIYNPREMTDMKGHWASADVNDMNSRLIIQGVTATEFRPDASVTRAEFASIVTRGLGIQQASYAGSFSDVEANQWYAGAIQAAVDYKLIDGYEDGTFQPEGNITRQEATVVLSRAAAIAKLKAELPDADASRVLAAFADGSDVSDWARGNVAAAVSLKLMNGRSDKLEPDANLTRAEAAALVRRFLQAAHLINP